MNILVLYDNEIKAWLVGEPLETAEEHIKNGYPHLLDSWLANTLKATIIEVPEDDAYRADLYQVTNNTITKKPEVNI